MKTTTRIIFLLLIFLMCISSVSATLDITVSDRGSNYITWEWTSPSNVSEMYVDNQLMCGYESTDPSVNIVDLTPNSCHTIALFADVGNNSDSACVSTTNMSFSSTSGGGNDSGMNMNAIVGIAGGIVGGLIGAMFIAGRLRKRNN